jgi:hypothetical protein
MKHQKDEREHGEIGIYVNRDSLVWDAAKFSNAATIQSTDF